MIPRLPFFGKERDAALSLSLSLSLEFCLYTALHYSRSMFSNFLVFHTPGSIFSRSANVQLLIFVSTISSSSSMNGSSLMSSWRLVIYLDRFISDFREFPSRFWECSFHSLFFLDWNLLVLVSRCSSFFSLHLLPVMLIGIVYLLQSFDFIDFAMNVF